MPSHMRSEKSASTQTWKQTHVSSLDVRVRPTLSAPSVLLPRETIGGSLNVADLVAAPILELVSLLSVLLPRVARAGVEQFEALRFKSPQLTVAPAQRLRMPPERGIRNLNLSDDLRHILQETELCHETCGTEA